MLDIGSGVDDDGGFTNASTNVQRNLRKAESGTLFIDEEQSASNVDTWYELHAARHREIGATPLPKAMFTGALQHMTPRDKARFFFVRLTSDPDRMVAGGFYIHHARVIDALMPAICGEFAHLAPNYLLAAHTIRWAKSRGLQYYNWQASPPGGGVHRFKKQWGSTDRPYGICTRITGDVSPFLETTAEFVRDAYRGHYVMPYDQIGVEPGAQASISSRKNAWNVMTATKQ